ncbi:MAG TPA: c-type cytochrome domain-containing protein, partial [Pirellulales bacterium]|nr:c-type cytochrome domain-containing protein [Pirellulales bacterium]
MFRKSFLFAASLLAIAAIDQGFATTSARAEAPVDFARDIKPLLSDRCFKCHGPDSETREADLRLDLRANAVEAAIVPGDVEESELYHRITSDDPDEKMPPVDSNRTALTPDEIALVRRWILQGAKYAEHWAYVRPVMPAVPLTREPELVANPVDAFLQARLQKEDLASAPE